MLTARHAEQFRFRFFDFSAARRRCRSADIFEQMLASSAVHTDAAGVRGAPAHARAHDARRADDARY
jgi:uncharacterized membrane protein